MIKKIISLVVFLIILISISQTITIMSYIGNNNIKGSNVSKDIIFAILPYIYTYGFDSNIMYSGKYIPTNKIDIVTSNHINTLDFMIQISLIRLFDSRELYFILKKDVMLIPGCFILASGNDIALNRKMEDDVDNITDKIKKIKEGVLVILPEGTRFTPEKLKLAQEYSTSNNLPVFNHILFPKMKGLWTICNILKNENKLGNIIDLTIVIENLKHKKTYLKELVFNKLGTTYVVINSYNIGSNIIEYDNFKKLFIQIWQKKDNILDNMTLQVNLLRSNNKYKFTKLIPSMKSHEYHILIVIITLFLYLAIHTNGIYIGVSLFISYFITFIKYKSLKKKYG